MKLEPNSTACSNAAGSDASRVSVVIPCYNQAHFLGDAIGSVLTQSYQCFEIIVVDDGSTDDTRDVAMRYPAARYLRQENKGLSAARNWGFANSGGEYVVFLDTDDRLLPEALEIGVKSLRTHPECAFVYGQLQFIAADGSLLPTPKPRQVRQDHCLELLRGDYIWTPGVVMYRRAALAVVGGFNPAINACADCDLNIRITRDFPVHFHERLVLEYRQHGGSMSANSALMLKTALAAHRLQFRYIQGNRSYEEASKIGKQAAQNYFGMHLIHEMRVHVKNHDLGRAFKGLIILARYHPRGLAVNAAQTACKLANRARNRLGFFQSSS